LSRTRSSSVVPRRTLPLANAPPHPLGRACATCLTLHPAVVAAAAAAAVAARPPGASCPSHPPVSRHHCACACVCTCRVPVGCSAWRLAASVSFRSAAVQQCSSAGRSSAGHSRLWSHSRCLTRQLLMKASREAYSLPQMGNWHVKIVWPSP
jgi:hypothetical protein